MIRNVYSFYHMDAKYFLKPEINDATPEQVRVSVLRDAVVNAGQYSKTGMQNCAFYCLGTFDDETGLFISQPSEIIKQTEMYEQIKKGIGYVEARTAPAGN